MSTSNSICQCDDLVEENKELRKTIAELYSQLIPTHESSAVENDHKIDCDENHSLLSRLNTELTKLSSQLKNEISLRHSCESELQKLKKDFKFKESSIKELAASASSLDTKLKMSEHESLSLRAEVIQIVPMKLIMKTMKDELDALVVKHKCLEQEFSTAHLTNATLNQEKVKLEVELQNARKLIAELTESMQDKISW
jgi:chromosome segregation ATPase